jgi:predicted PurR-regulated permease PerM
MNDTVPNPSRFETGQSVQLLLAVFLITAALYLARPLFEPIAFALFGMALVWPIQKALEARLSKFAALSLTILLTLVVMLVFTMAIVWSIDDVVHWTIANIASIQALYERWTMWLAGYGIFITEGVGQYDASAFVGVLRTIASGANYFSGFSIAVFLLLTFGLTELDDFRTRLDSLAPKIGQDICRTTAEIAGKIRKYMMIRTTASIVTGLAVFAFTFSISLDLATAWGIISFVLNYIPYVGTLVAIVLPVLFARVQFESWQMALFVFCSLYLIQFLIGSYLEPIIAGRTLAISPFVMLVAFFFWAFLWGIPGAFIGLPVTIALLTICEQHTSLNWLAKLLSAG